MDEIKVNEETTDIRKDFPQFGYTDYIYLDNAATTWKPNTVISAMERFYGRSYSNIHRSVYYLGRHAEEQYEDARRAVGRFLGADDTYETIFTHGATDALNLLAVCLTEHMPKDGNVVITQMEHYSNYLPWEDCCRRMGTRLRVVPVLDDGSLDMDAFYSMTDRHTCAVSVTGASNVSGYRPPLREMAAYAHEKNAAFIVDASQLVVHCRLNLEQVGYDAVCFSGHKLYGPTGIGVLCGKRKFLETLGHYQLGGGMVEEELPWRLEAGTPPVCQAIGMKAAVTYLEEHSFEKMLRREQRLFEDLKAELRKYTWLQMLEPKGETLPVLSFTSEILSPYDMALLLDSMHIAVRSGKHCAGPYLQALHKEGVVRVSTGIYTREKDLEALCKGLKKIGERHGRKGDG